MHQIASYYFSMWKKVWSFLLVENMSIAEWKWSWKHCRWKRPWQALSTSMDVRSWKRTALTLKPLWFFVRHSYKTSFFWLLVFILFTFTLKILFNFGQPFGNYDVFSEDLNNDFESWTFEIFRISFFFF